MEKEAAPRQKMHWACINIYDYLGGWVLAREWIVVKHVYAMFGSWELSVRWANINDSSFYITVALKYMYIIKSETDMY